jgi:Ca2+-binding EF-hand superfamily protein
MKAMFEATDGDNSGALDANELISLLGESGNSAAMAPMLIRIFDRDGDGCITFREFVEFLDLTEKMKLDPLALYRSLFEAMDPQKRGELTGAELVEFAQLLGIQVTHADAGELVKAMDADENGTISFDEIVKSLGLE